MLAVRVLGTVRDGRNQHVANGQSRDWHTPGGGLEALGPEPELCCDLVAGFMFLDLHESTERGEIYTDLRVVCGTSYIYKLAPQ